MRWWWLLVFALLAIPTEGQAACSKTSTDHWLAVSWTDLQDCVVQATPGDTIEVQAGTVTANSPLILNKFVKIIPQGTVNLIDNSCPDPTVNDPYGCRGGNHTDNMVTITTSPDGSIQFGNMNGTTPAGFIISRDTSRGANTNIHLSPNGVIRIAGGGDHPVLIIGNTYNIGGRGDFIMGQGPMGVIAHNTIVATVGGSNCASTASLFRGENNRPAWTQVPKYGADDTDGNYKWYVESNTMIRTAENMDGGTGTRAVIRFNTFIDSAIVNHGPDSQEMGNRYWELYNNSFTETRMPQEGCGGLIVNLNGFIGVRGGNLYMFNNNVPPARGWATSRPSLAQTVYMPWRRMQAGPWRCWDTPLQPNGYMGYPIPYIQGWGWNGGGTQAGNTSVFMDREPEYIGGNAGADGTNSNYDNGGRSMTGQANECESEDPNPSTTFLHLDREMYIQTSPFNGTTGTGTGTLANRPATCTTGVGYWATDQGNWNKTNNAGPGVNAQGVLYTCTAPNTWTLKYTPYEYPHPLTNLAPPPPGMVFTSQPSAILNGQAFVPDVAVRELPPVAGHSITLTTGGTGCSSGGSATAMTNANGVATFTGLTASAATRPASCNFTAMNPTTSGMVTSANFTVSDVPAPPSGCNNTDLGNGWTCVAESAGHLGANGGQLSPAIDSTSAGSNNLIVVGIAAHELNNPMCSSSGGVLADTLGNILTPLGKVMSQGSAVDVQMFYKANGSVGSNHSITCAGTDTYPVAVLAVFKPADPNQTVIVNTASSTNPVTSLQNGSVTPNSPNALVVTMLGTAVLAGSNHTINQNFHTVVDVPGEPIGAFGGNIGGAMAALTMGAPAAVNPTWSFTQTEIPAAQIAVFNLLNPGESISWQTQPQATQSGQAMASFTLHATSGVTGLVALSHTDPITAVDSCPGVSFAGSTTATVNGGTITFSNLTPTGTATGCKFWVTGNAGAVVSPASNPFNITSNVPPLTVTLAVVEGNCTIVGSPTAVVDGTGHATFTGLVAGTPGTNCQIEASAPGHTAVISNLFDVTNLPPGAIQVVSSSCAGNNVPLNTTGADMLLMIATANAASTITPSDTIGGTATSGSWNAGVFVNLSDHQLRMFTKVPQGGGTGANHTFAISSARSGLCVMALSGTHGMAPIVTGTGQNTSATSMVGLSSPLVLNQNAFVVSGFSPVSGPRNPPSGYASLTTLATGTSPNNTFGAGMAWHSGMFGSENPTWSTPETPEPMATIAAAWPNVDVVPMPVLSFQTQPSTTPSGQTMTAFAVTHTGTLSGTVTLTPANCPGVSFQGLTATISGSTATFASVIPTGTGTGCTFIASAPGATSSGASNAFNVTTIPVLSFQTQPTSTQSGATMASFIVAHTGTLTGNVTLTPNNCSGVSFSGLTATISGSTTTFNAVVPTGISSGCYFTASASGATTSGASNAFDVIGIPLGLSFTQHPTDTVNGGAFNPPIAGRMTVATTR